MASPLPPDGLTQEELVSQGWERRAMLAPDRLVEAQAIYQELGLDVLIRSPEDEHFGSDCSLCRAHACSEYRVLYTRRKIQ